MGDLVFDVRRGATAGALLGALLEAGASLEDTEAAVSALGRGEVRLQVQATPAGSTVRIRAPQGAPIHETWSDLRPRIQLLAVDEDVVGLALATLDALFEARATVHGVPTGDVDVDPLSGPDDLANAVALAAATVSLGPDRITVTEVGHGTGTLSTIEGDVPLPGPVVAALLAGSTTLAHDVEVELVDPVGAAWVRAAAAGPVPLPTDEQVDQQGRGRLPDGSSAAVLVATGAPTAPAA